MRRPAKKNASRGVRPPPPVLPADDPSAIYVRVPVGADVAAAIAGHGQTAIDLAHGLASLASAFRDIVVQASLAGEAIERDVRRLTNPRRRHKRRR